MTGTRKGAAGVSSRSPWIDTVRGLSVFAVVLFHVWIWILEPLADDYWAPAEHAWGYANSHLGIRMPLLLLVSGMLASSAIRSGLRFPKVRLRIATNYYLYVVWLAVLTIFSFVLPAGDLPHRIASLSAALQQLLVPETPLWYVMALAIYAFVLALLAPLRPAVVLTGLAALSITSGMYQTPGLWQRILALMVFFAIGVYAKDWLWRVEHWATVPRGIALLIVGEAFTQAYVRLAPESVLAGLLDFARLGAFGLAALVMIARLIAIPAAGRLGSYLGHRTLAVYTSSIVVLWILVLLVEAHPAVLHPLAIPVVALVAPLVLAIAVTVIGLVARPGLEAIGLAVLYTMPASWDAWILGEGAQRASGSLTEVEPAHPRPAAPPALVPGTPASERVAR